MTWALDSTTLETVTWRREADGFLVGFVREGFGEPSSGVDAPPADIDSYAPPVEVPPEYVARPITKLALRSRFTMTEKAAIEFAAVDDPSASMPERQMAATLRSQLRDLEAANEIHLDHPDLIAGVRALEQVGIIAAGRADEILLTPILDSELA